mgnify:CR=1 FL=1
MAGLCKGKHKIMVDRLESILRSGLALGALVGVGSALMMAALYGHPQVVRLLLEACAKGSVEPDALGRLPLHYALSNGAQDDVVQLLLDTTPNAARGTDRRGWLPLHVACSVGASTKVIVMILQAYPEGAITLTNKGTSAERTMDAHTAQNKEEVRRIIKQYKSQVNSRLGNFGRISKQPSEERMLV